MLSRRGSEERGQAILHRRALYGFYICCFFFGGFVVVIGIYGLHGFLYDPSRHALLHPSTDPSVFVGALGFFGGFMGS